MDGRKITIMALGGAGCRIISQFADSATATKANSNLFILMFELFGKSEFFQSVLNFRTCHEQIPQKT